MSARHAEPMSDEDIDKVIAFVELYATLEIKPWQEQAMRAALKGGHVRLASPRRGDRIRMRETIAILDTAMKHLVDKETGQ